MSNYRPITDYRWRILIEYYCEHCGCGFTSTKPAPKFCSHKCFLDASKESRSARVRSLWEDESFRMRIQLARKRAGYPDKNRPDAVARRKLRTAAKNAVARCLRHCGGRKNGKTFQLLGYTPEQFRNHVESKLLPSMSWENYGAWEIDHIKPIASFPVTAPLSEINALTNLQPLWKLDNRRKRDVCQ